MSKKEKGLSPYHTNKKIRVKIDSLLQQNARNVANLGTKSKYDLGSEDAVNKAWADIEVEIGKLDTQIYNTIIKQDD